MRTKKWIFALAGGLLLASGLAWADGPQDAQFIAAAKAGNLDSVKAFLGVSGAQAQGNQGAPGVRTLPGGNRSSFGATRVQPQSGSGANINAVDADGYTALIWAAGNGHVDVVRLLIDQRADLNRKVTRGTKHVLGQTAMILAAVNGHMDIVRLLAERGADVNAATDQGISVLCFVSGIKAQADLVGFLLDRRADPHARTREEGDTPLMIAARYGCSENVRLLLGKNAEVNARNNQGETALSKALLFKNQEAANLLRNAGAR
jgi:ankyrin repeat protein